MSIEIYSPSKAKLVHKTKANFGGSMETFKKVSLMQYDKNLPVIAVELYKDKEKYTLPSFNVTVKVKWKKPDKTFVYKDVLGCNKDRTIVYFEADEQMTYSKGNVFTILELIVNGEVAGSSPLNVYIEENPIQSGDIESAIEMPLAPVALTGDYNDLTNKPEGMKSAIQDYEDELPNIDDTNDDEIARLDSLNIHYPKSDSTIVKGQFNHIFNENGKAGTLINIVEMINEINQNGNVIYSYEISACTARPYPADFSNYWQLNFHGTDKDSNYLRFDFEYPMLNFNLLVSTGFNINSLSGLIATDYDGCMLKFEYYDESGLVGNDKILLNKAYKDDDPNEFNLTNYSFNSASPFTSVVMYAEYYDEGYANYKINLYQMHIQFNNNLTSYKWSKIADEDNIKELENKNSEQDNLISNNEDSINDLYNYCGELEGKIGDIPIYRVLELPLPRSEYTNAIYKLENKYYICKNFGESKYTPGDLSELTYNQNPISENYYPIISGMLDNYLRVTAADKVYSDYGRLKFSSSSALGQLTLHKELELPMTKITLHLIPYNSLKASVISIKYTTDGGESYNYIADHFSFNAEKDYTFNSGLPRNGTADIIIQSDSETSLQDRRFYISSIALEFGRSNFEWTYFVDGFELENKQDKITPGTYLDGPITVVSSTNDTEPLNIDYSNGDTYFISIFDRDSGSSLKIDMNVLDECEMYVHFPIRENMNDASVAYEEWVNINYSSATNLQNGESIGSLLQAKEATSWTGIDENGNETTYISKANGIYSVAFGPKSQTNGKGSISAGTKSYAGYYGFAFGDTVYASDFGFATGFKTIAKGAYSTAEGSQSIASAESSHAEGIKTKALAPYAHAEGSETEARGNSSHAEGISTVAEDAASHAEGNETIARSGSHAEGWKTQALGVNSHTEGCLTRVLSNEDFPNIETNPNIPDIPSSGEESSEFGPYWTIPNGYYAHSEGFRTTALGSASHAEGNNTKSIGPYSHAQGESSIAKHKSSFVSGTELITGAENQSVFGKYNKEKQSALLIVGNGFGTSDDMRQNAFEVYQDGHAEIQTVGNTNNSVVNKQYVDSKPNGNKFYIHRIIMKTDAPVPDIYQYKYYGLTIISTRSTAYSGPLYHDNNMISVMMSEAFDWGMPDEPYVDWGTKIQLIYSTGSSFVFYGNVNVNLDYYVLLDDAQPLT